MTPADVARLERMARECEAEAGRRGWWCERFMKDPEREESRIDVLYATRAALDADVLRRAIEELEGVSEFPDPEAWTSEEES